MSSQEIAQIQEHNKKYFLNLKKEEIESLTKYVVKFEDCGQDFLEFHIDEDGWILDSKPFQRNIWAGYWCCPQTARVGGQLPIWIDGENFIKYPIEKIEVKAQ